MREKNPPGLRVGWRRRGFVCDERISVGALCAGLPPRLRQEFIEPLCVSALNTPMAEASAQVFLRVLRDALFAERGGSNLLLPRVDLSALFPQAAARWIEEAARARDRAEQVQLDDLVAARMVAHGRAARRAAAGRSRCRSEWCARSCRCERPVRRW